MLYVTTRNNANTIPSAQVLRQGRSEDGGLYIPYRRPMFSPAQIRELGKMSFGQCVAEVLNLLLDTQLTSWDVDFSIGRYPVRLQSLGHRVIVAECWHNPDWSFDRVVKNLAAHLGAEDIQPGSWVPVAVRTAVLFGIFSELSRLDIHQADICMVAGDCTALASGWYARELGLPVGNLIGCCNENTDLWELHVNGAMATDTAVISTSVPAADIACPVDLERLLYACGGRAEALRFGEAVASGSVYTPQETAWEQLRKGQYISVVSSQRLSKLIPGTYASHRYLHGTASALAYAGLLDYRARTGQIRPAVILSEQSPLLEKEYLSSLLGVENLE